MEIINISIDKCHDLAYIRFSDAQIAATRSISDSINVDIDKVNKIVGIEYLSLAARFPKSEEFLSAFELTGNDSREIENAEKILN